MGRTYGRQERGEALAAYAEEALAKVDKAMAGLPAEKRPRVYMAIQADGLATVCRGSERAEAIEMAGGYNVHECLPGTENSALHITFEQLMAYDPDVILVYHPNLAKRIPDDANWKRLRAVKEGRLYLMPRGPFTWLERPATYMRLIGVQWLTKALHPDLFPMDMKAETKTFMKLFFHADLSDEMVEKILDPLKVDGD
jgi:iron complex transport system substrate-binding protein